MPRIAYAAALLLPLAAAGCSASESTDAAPFNAGDSAFPDATSDRDDDGLCDVTEAEVGTSEDNADTDGDGIPDTAEVIAGFDPQGPTDPAPDLIAYLSFAQTEQDFDVSLTVEGNGQAATGRLNARSALDPASRRADQLYRGSTAIAADPPDNVRDLKAEDGRFGRILGRVRLRYRLRFSPDAVPETSCAASLPFDYYVEDDQETVLAREHYLLVLTSDRAALTAEQFCRPAACL